MLSWIKPIHPFVSHKLWELLIILRISWDLNCLCLFLLHRLLIREWAHATGTWKAEHLISTFHSYICGRWLWVYLWVWYHSHVMMIFHSTSHCGISSDRSSACRLCIHRLLNKLCKHTCCRDYPMIILSVLLRYCLDLISNVIAIMFCMISEMSSPTSHRGRFKIRHVGCDPAMSPCQPLYRIMNNLPWQCIQVVSHRINTFPRLHWLSLSNVLLLRIRGLSGYLVKHTVLLVILRSGLWSLVGSMLFILWAWAQVMEMGERVRGGVVDVLGLVRWGVREVLLEDHLLLGLIRAVPDKLPITADLLFISAVPLHLMRPPDFPLIHRYRLNLHCLLLLPATSLDRPKRLILVSLGWIQQELFFLETINGLQKVLAVRGVLGTEVFQFLQSFLFFLSF